MGNFALFAIARYGGKKMSLSRIQTAYEERVRVAYKSITHADLTDADTSQSIEFDDALPANAMVIGSSVVITEEFASPAGVATAATKTGAAEPYTLTAGWTVVLDTDNNGNETITFDAAAGYVEGDDYYPVADQDGLTLEISVNGESPSQECTFSGATTTATAIRDAINAQITGVSASVETGVGYRKAAIKECGVPPYVLSPAQTIVLDTDNLGNETITFDAAAGSVTDTTSYPCADQTGLTEVVTIDEDDGGTEQTVTFGTATTAQHICDQLNAGLTGCSVAVVGGQVVITSDKKGKHSKVKIGTGTCGLSWAAAANGTGDVDDIKNVTATEFKTRVEGDSIATVDISGAAPIISSPSTGSGSELDFKSGTALTACGLSVEVIPGTAGQVVITSDLEGTDSSVEVTGGTSTLTFLADVPGTGDVADIANVTAAEVIDRIEDDSIAEAQTASGGRFTILSPTTGALSELDFKSGGALTELGLAVEVKTGSAATAAGTADVSIGMSGGDEDCLMDAGDASGATGVVNGPKGVASDGIYGGETPVIVIDTSGPNCNLFNEGELTAFVMYVDLTKALV